MTTAFSVYLAGPEVFLPNARAILDKKRDICAQMGWEGLSPVDNEISAENRTPTEMATAIYQGNLAMMMKADAIIANISPFRGPHMDPGTAFEIGFFACANKPIMVYTQHPDELVDRVMAWSGNQSVTQHGHEMRDRNQHLIENFGLRENLMIDSSIDNQGIDADVVVSPVPFEQVFQCHKGFEEAAQRLHELLIDAQALRARRPRA